jgi:hypothetical protein
MEERKSGFRGTVERIAAPKGVGLSETFHGDWR